MAKSLEELKAEVKALDIEVDSVKPDHVVVLELLEELGEISHAITWEMGHKKHRPVKEEIKEEIGDLLYLLLRLAYLKDVDLEKQLDYTMRKISGKIKSKDWHR